MNASEFNHLLGWISGSYAHSFLPKTYPFLSNLGEERCPLRSGRMRRERRNSLTRLNLTRCLGGFQGATRIHFCLKNTLFLKF